MIRLDDDVDRLYTAVKLYLTQISREALDEKDGRRWAEIMSLTINLEHVGDILERIVQDLRDKKIAPSPVVLRGRHEGDRGAARRGWCANLRLGLSVFLNGDLKSAQMLIAREGALPRPRARATPARTSTASRARRCSRSRPARCTWTSSATCAASTRSSARPPIRSSSRPGSCAAAACVRPRPWPTGEFAARPDRATSHGNAPWPSGSPTSRRSSATTAASGTAASRVTQLEHALQARKLAELEGATRRAHHRRLPARPGPHAEPRRARRPPRAASTTSTSTSRFPFLRAALPAGGDRGRSACTSTPSARSARSSPSYYEALSRGFEAQPHAAGRHLSRAPKPRTSWRKPHAERRDARAPLGRPGQGRRQAHARPSRTTSPSSPAAPGSIGGSHPVSWSGHDEGAQTKQPQRHRRGASASPTSAR